VTESGKYEGRGSGGLLNTNPRIFLYEKPLFLLRPGFRPNASSMHAERVILYPTWT